MQHLQTKKEQPVIVEIDDETIEKYARLVGANTGIVLEWLRNDMVTVEDIYISLKHGKPTRIEK